MSPDQKAAYRAYRIQLREAYSQAMQTAFVKGRMRTWSVPYLQAVLRVYYELDEQIIDGKSLRRALGKRRRAVRRLLKTAGRDPKTRSRWMMALLGAIKQKVSPGELPIWLADGGGISGRATEYTASRRPKAPDEPKIARKGAVRLEAHHRGIDDAIIRKMKSPRISLPPHN